MSIYSSLVSEVKKGCGKVTHGNEEMGTLNCGDRLGKWDEFSNWVENNELNYCESCQAKLGILAKFKDMAEKKLDLMLINNKETYFTTEGILNFKQKLLGEGK